MKRRKARTAKPAPAKRRVETKPRIASRPAASASRKAPKPALRAVSKPAQPDALDTLITASARELRLPLDPAWLPGVKFNLNLILRIAATVDEFPLPDDAEPGPVFHA